MKRLVAVILLFLASVFAAAPPQTTVRRSDIEIESAIKTKLAKSKIGKDGFQVRVRNGVAIWQGSTSVPQHKGAATRMAKTAGAVQVVNNIKIINDGKQKGPGDPAGTPRKIEVNSK